jgi:nucleoredoxin
MLQPLVDPSTGEAFQDLDKFLENKRVALYFTAGWCPMCTSFEPSLIAFRQAAQDSGKPVEILYVSSDRNKDASLQRAASLGMMAIPFGNQTAELKQRYKVWAGSESFEFGFGRRSGVPALVVLDKYSQELAFVAAEAQGLKALKSWDLDDDLGIWGT